MPYIHCYMHYIHYMHYMHYIHIYVYRINTYTCTYVLHVYIMCIYIYMSIYIYMCVSTHTCAQLVKIQAAKQLCLLVLYPHVLFVV